MRTILFASIFAMGCGGGAPVAKTPDVPVAITTTAAPVANTPPLFTGSFDVVSMTDGKDVLVVGDLFRRMRAHAGQMTWAMTADSFTLGMWQASLPEKLDDKDTANTFSEFCRASGTVSAHWEGSTLVLASTIKAQGAGSLVRVFQKVDGAATTHNVTTRSTTCDASFTATRITFEILERDAEGPVRIRAKSTGVTLDLARGRPIASIDPHALFTE